jgi:hypothetical protein
MPVKVAQIYDIEKNACTYHLELPKNSIPEIAEVIKIKILK